MQSDSPGQPNQDWTLNQGHRGAATLGDGDALTGYQKDDGDLELGGWVRRYDLCTRPSETEVTLS